MVCPFGSEPSAEALDEMGEEGLIAMSEFEVIRYVHQDGGGSPAS
jgi:hypothetical protein